MSSNDDSAGVLVGVVAVVLLLIAGGAATYYMASRAQLERARVAEMAALRGARSGHDRAGAGRGGGAWPASR